MPLAAKIAPIEAAPAAVTPPKLRLASRQVPIGGFWYRLTDPPGIVGPFNDPETCYKETNRRLLANGKPPITQADVVQQNCERLPPGYCRDASGRRTKHAGAFSLTLPDVVAGTKALMKWAKHGSVPVEETVRRTYICNECPENVPIAGCQGCAASRLHSVMNAIVVKPLPSDAVLGACSVCKCSLKAKTRMRLEDLPPLTAEQRARLPEGCWMIADASEQRNDPRV